MIRRAPISGLPVILALLLGCVACTKSQRVDTIHATVVAVDAARDGFTSWDLAHQQALVDASASRDDATKAVAEYRLKQAQIVNGFEVAYRALAVAATQTDEPSLKAALAAASDLIDAIKRLKGGPQ